MKILVCGSRWWTDEEWIRRVLSQYPADTVIVHGDNGYYHYNDDGDWVLYRGADKLADKVAKSLGMTTLPFPYLSEFGKSGGIKRNIQMLDENPDIELVICFHEDLYGSTGSKHMVTIAKKAGIPVEIYGC